MDWFAPIHASREQVDGAFWAEPFGAIADAAFMVAAGAAGWRASRQGNRVGVAFAGLVGVIGAGSFLSHMLAVQWAMLADVIPIAVFLVADFGLALARFLGLPVRIVVPGVLAFALVDIALTPALETSTGLPLVRLAHGSLDDLPAFAALLGVAAALAGCRPATMRDLALIARCSPCR